MRLQARSLVRLALAHHPRCHPFREDVFRVGPVSLCVGCWTAYPVAFGILGLLLHLGPGLVDWRLAALVGVPLGSGQLLAAAGWTRTRARKVVAKSFFGASVGCLAYMCWVLPVVPWVRLAVFLGLALVATLLALPRGRRMRTTCESCFFKGDWERCSGMALVAPPVPPARRPATRPAPRDPQAL